MPCSSPVASWFLKASTKNHCGLRLRAKKSTGTPRVSKSRCQRERSHDACQEHSDDTVPMANAAGGWQGDCCVFQGSRRRISNSGNLASTARGLAAVPGEKLLPVDGRLGLRVLDLGSFPGIAGGWPGTSGAAGFGPRFRIAGGFGPRFRLRSEIPHRRLL